jgi:hypothetical protein
MIQMIVYKAIKIMKMKFKKKEKKAIISKKK